MKLHIASRGRNDRPSPCLGGGTKRSRGFRAHRWRGWTRIFIKKRLLQSIECNFSTFIAFYRMHNLFIRNFFVSLRRCIIVTRDEEENVSSDGLTIDVVPIWKWLL